MSKKVKNQVKKKSWFSILWRLGQDQKPVLLSDFSELKYYRRFRTCLVKRSKPLGDNRCAYNVLKRYYSTTTLKWLRCYFEVNV